MTYHYTNVNTSPYVVQPADVYLSVDCSSIPITVQFPDVSQVGRIFAIKDRTGNAATNNITVTTVSGLDLIDGNSTYIMDANYQSIQVAGDSVGYEIY